MRLTDQIYMQWENQIGQTNDLNYKTINLLIKVIKILFPYYTIFDLSDVVYLLSKYNDYK